MFVPHAIDNWADVSEWLIGKPLRIVVLALVGVALRWALHRIVDRIVKRAEQGMLPDKLADRLVDRMGERAAMSPRRVQRAKTMGDLLKSIITGIIVAVFGTMILDQVGINIAPIIASAGIIGIALGFGAQSLVKDYLSGIFMIFEDQYGVGDVVDVGSASGTVEAVSLRVTRLRALDGTVWYVPNGEILRVGNMSQNWARAVIDVNVGYAEDISRVKPILEDVAHGLWLDDDFKHVVIEEPEVPGVEAMTADAVTVRVLVKTKPLEQWGVARELRARIKARLDHEGIEIPFQQRVVWHREDKRAARLDEEHADSTAAATATATTDAS